VSLTSAHSWWSWRDGRAQFSGGIGENDAAIRADICRVGGVGMQLECARTWRAFEARISGVTRNRDLRGSADEERIWRAPTAELLSTAPKPIKIKAGVPTNGRHCQNGRRRNRPEIVGERLAGASIATWW